MVFIDLFGNNTKKKPSPQQPTPQPQTTLDTFIEIAYRMLSSGKSEAEVAAFLHSKGLQYEQIDKIVQEAIKKQATLSKPSQPTPSTNIPSKASTPASATIKQQALDINSIISMVLETVIEEMEEIVDVIIQNKYGNIKSRIEEMNTIKENIENIQKDINKTIEDLEKRQNEKLSELDKKINNLNKKLEEIVPKLEALESAFKDNIPNIINDLRKLEAKIENKDSNEPLTYTHSKSKEKDKKEETNPLKEIKFDDLIN